MEQRIYVPVQRQLKQEFGYRTASAGVNSTYRKVGYEGESLMLTGDLNLADVEWVVQYRVNDPFSYLFKVRNADETLRDISEAAMRQIVGDRTVNEVLTVGRADVASQAEAIIQKLCNEYEIGLTIEQVVLQDINPPDPVKTSSMVLMRFSSNETLINQARADYNGNSTAAGEAQRLFKRQKIRSRQSKQGARGSIPIQRFI